MDLLKLRAQAYGIDQSLPIDQIKQLIAAKEAGVANINAMAQAFAKTDEYKQAKAIYDKHEDSLFDRPEVTGASFVGYPQPKIKIFLKYQVTDFPTSIEGLPIETEVIGDAVAY